MGMQRPLLRVEIRKQKGDFVSDVNPAKGRLELHAIESARIGSCANC
jgi:hypothetical protein